MINVIMSTTITLLIQLRVIIAIGRAIVNIVIEIAKLIEIIVIVFALAIILVIVTIG